jgi:hypothetical protein
LLPYALSRCTVQRPVRRDGVQYYVPRIRGGAHWEGDVVAEGSAETVEAAGRPAQTLETWTIERACPRKKGLQPLGAL